MREEQRGLHGMPLSAETAHDVRADRVGDRRGSRFQSAINGRYFGFSGLFCGTVTPRRAIFVVRAARRRTPSSA